MRTLFGLVVVAGMFITPAALVVGGFLLHPLVGLLFVPAALAFYFGRSPQ